MRHEYDTPHPRDIKAMGRLLETIKINNLIYVQQRLWDSNTNEVEAEMAVIHACNILIDWIPSELDLLDIYYPDEEDTDEA